MRIYVATKWEERERAQAVMRVLYCLGHQITYDWTRSEQFSEEQALCDVMGIHNADMLVILAEKDLPYKGTYVEFGVALTLGLPVYIIGPGFDRCIFVKLPGVSRMATFEEFLACLKQQAA
jgi:hypothetical protein